MPIDSGVATIIGLKGIHNTVVAIVCIFLYGQFYIETRINGVKTFVKLIKQIELHFDNGKLCSAGAAD